MSKRVLYMECQSGISGDMTVAALLDLGADRAAMDRALNSLPISGFRTQVRRVEKSGLDVCDFSVILDPENENHDHDMEYLHGHSHDGEEHSYHEHDHYHEHNHYHEHDHSHEHGHSHEHDHSHEHEHSHDGIHTHVHEHRSLPGILHILSHADMTPRALELASRIFQIIAAAEAKAHGVPMDQVHFHEVGAVDSIVDITAAAVLIDSLQVDDVIIPELCEGQGWVRCQHGILPVPVPAVLHIAEATGLILRRIPIEGELVTPTGAAIAAAIRTGEVLPDRYRILRSGIGAGKRKYERPSLLRAMLLETAETSPDKDVIVKLETNVDDCSGETLGYVMDLLFEAGARDVNYTPVFMKKNRPAYQINMICSPEDVDHMEDILFRETTTIGIRRIHMERTILVRKKEILNTEYGPINMKICSRNGWERAYPEYEDLKKICREKKISYPEAYQLAVEAWHRQKYKNNC